MKQSGFDGPPHRGKSHYQSIPQRIIEPNLVLVDAALNLFEDDTFTGIRVTRSRICHPCDGFGGAVQRFLIEGEPLLILMDGVGASAA